MHTPVSAGAALWPACLEVLAQELPEQQFNTWIKPLNAQLATDQSKLTLFVANRFKLDWVRAQYATRIAGILESLHGQPVNVELALAPRTAPVKYTYQEAAAPAGGPVRSRSPTGRRAPVGWESVWPSSLWLWR